MDKDERSRPGGLPDPAPRRADYDSEPGWSGGRSRPRRSDAEEPTDPWEPAAATFGQGDEADVLPPGPPLAGLTEEAVMDLGGLSDDELIGVLQATRRQMAREQYKQVLVTAEFARRRQAAFEDAARRGVPVGCRPGGFPGEELTAEMVVTPAEAGHRIDDAIDLTTRLPRTLAGMAAGEIDLERAGWIALYTRSLSPADAAAADEILAGAAPDLRPDQVARRAAAIEMRLAPEAVKARRERVKRNEQRVEARREWSGNACLSGREMDTADVMASKAYLDAIAIRLRNGCPAWSPASAVTAIPSACRPLAARCDSIRVMTATISSTPWRSASPRRTRFSTRPLPASACRSSISVPRPVATASTAPRWPRPNSARTPTPNARPFKLAIRFRKSCCSKCLEIMHQGCVIAIQDMGAGGLTCSAVEMGAKGDLGVTLDLDRVPCREEGMSAYEMMLSESQERMLMVLKPEKEKEAEAIFRKWGLDFAIVGETTPDKRFIVRHRGDEMVNLPIKELGDQAPESSGLSSARPSLPSSTPTTSSPDGCSGRAGKADRRAGSVLQALGLGAIRPHHSGQHRAAARR